MTLLTSSEKLLQEKAVGFGRAVESWLQQWPALWRLTRNGWAYGRPPPGSSPIDWPHEVLSLAVQATLAARETYDARRGAPLECWVAMCIHHTIKAHVRKQRAFYDRWVADERPEPWSSEECSSLLANRDEVEYVLTLLDSDERRFLLLRYFTGKTLKEIAEEEQRSCAWSCQRSQRILQELQHILEGNPRGTRRTRRDDSSKKTRTPVKNGKPRCTLSF